MSTVLDGAFGSSTEVAGYDLYLQVGEVEQLVQDAARHLRKHGWPTAPSWRCVESMTAWTVAFPTDNEPAVSLTPPSPGSRLDGQLQVGWSSHQAAHVASVWEILHEFGPDRFPKLYEGLQYILTRQHPEVVCID